MLKEKRLWIAGLMMVGLLTLMDTPAFAKSISLKDAGIGLWVIIIIGAVIVLLQFIPAAILFFSFIGTTSAMVFKGKKAPEEVVAEEKGIVTLPGFEPEPIKSKNEFESRRKE